MHKTEGFLQKKNINFKRLLGPFQELRGKRYLKKNIARGNAKKG